MLSLLIGCDDTGSGEPSTTDRVSSTPAVEASFLVDDVRIVRVPDDVAVHWDLVFDAVWVGGSAPEPIRCRWRIENREGEVVQVGIVNITAERLDDQVAGTIYPDEVPGVPERGDIRC